MKKKAPPKRGHYMSIVAVAVFDKNCVVAMVEATEGRKHYAASRSPERLPQLREPPDMITSRR
jgi:hypothetical protein